MSPEIRYWTGSYWYEFWFSECVLCGSHKNYKERRYGPPPPVQERYHFDQYACGDHFC